MAKDREFAGTDNNRQSTAKVEHGEKKKGRLSQFKNSSAMDQDYPDQYIDPMK